MTTRKSTEFDLVTADELIAARYQRLLSYGEFVEK